MISFYINWLVSTFFGALSQNRYNPTWDEKLNELLDSNDIKDMELDRWTLTIANAEIWIGNEYYSYGHLYRVKLKSHSYFTSQGVVEERPKVSTMYRLDKVVKELKVRKRAIENAKNEVFLNELLDD